MEAVTDATRAVFSSVLSNAPRTLWNKFTIMLLHILPISANERTEERVRRLENTHGKLYGTQTGRDDLLLTSIIDPLYSFFAKQEDIFLKIIWIFCVYGWNGIVFFTFFQNKCSDNVFTTVSSTAFVYMGHCNQHKMKFPLRDLQWFLNILFWHYNKVQHTTKSWSCSLNVYVDMLITVLKAHRSPQNQHHRRKSRAARIFIFINSKKGLQSVPLNPQISLQAFPQILNIFKVPGMLDLHIHMHK